MSTNIEKAREIANRAPFYIRAGGSLRENVAQSIAEGIALGRKEGLELAAEAIRSELTKLVKDSN
jgi:flagellar biosynthesis/type III secretory pathway protein FliH